MANLEPDDFGTAQAFRPEDAFTFPARRLTKRETKERERNDAYAAQFRRVAFARMLAGTKEAT